MVKLLLWSRIQVDVGKIGKVLTYNYDVHQFVMDVLKLLYDIA